MKTTLKLTAVAVSMMVLAGCGSSDPAAAPAAPGSPGTGAAAGDCQAAVASFRTMIATFFQNAIPSEGTEKNAAIRQALTDYAGQARSQSAKVGDPALRAALEKHAAAADKLSKAEDPTDLEDPDFAGASGDIEKVCADLLTPTASPGSPVVRLGPAGSACRLPVSFDLLPLWKPKAVNVADLGELADLYRNGPFEVACEVDAKPAGEIGFLRVYVAPGRTGDPRGHLEAFIAGENPDARKAGNFEVRKTDYRELTIGGQAAAEVTYVTYNKSMEHTSKYSAFAVNTPEGAVVVKLSPFGEDEHANVLPAFELAEKTLG